MTIAVNTLAHIRYGFGLSPDGPVLNGAPDVLDQLSRFDPASSRPNLKTRFDLHHAFLSGRKIEKEIGKTLDRVTALKTDIRQITFKDYQIELARQIRLRAGFAERLAAFWTDHFTVAARGRYLGLLHGAFVDDAIRPHVSGNFADLLIAATTHPAMLLYLDQNTSIGPNSLVGQMRGKGLNENLAREILELHTLGVGSGYSQTDVTQFAELLTGLRVTRAGVEYLPRFAEPGSEQVLGTSYGGPEGALKDVEKALRDIALRPETARHLAWKLAVHFVDDTPDADLIDHVARAYIRSGGDLAATYAALLDHPAAWVPELRKVKRPADFVVSALRAFGASADYVQDMPIGQFRQNIIAPLYTMGQKPHQPRGPDGWPEHASAWITPATLAARIKWATELARKYGQDIDPRMFVQTALADAASENTTFLVAGSESKWEGIALALASPEFNRR